MAIIAGALLNEGRHVVGRYVMAWIVLARITDYALFIGAQVRSLVRRHTCICHDVMLRRASLMFPYRTIASTFAFIASKNEIWLLRMRAKSSPVVRIIRGASPENLLIALSSNPLADKKKPRVLWAFPLILPSKIDRSFCFVATLVYFTSTR